MAEPAPATYLQPPRRHIIGMEGVPKEEIEIDLSELYRSNRQDDKKSSLAPHLINVFFENHTRTRTSFELAGKRLADVINMSVSPARLKKVRRS